MRKLVFASLASATALAAASPAAARDGEWYAGIEAGGLMTDDLEVDGDFRYFDVHGETDTGIDGDLVIGRDFGMLRLEAEAGYKTFGLDELDPDLWDEWEIWEGWGDDPPVEPANGGDIDVFSAMLNAMLDVGGDDSFGLTAGGGIGIARTSVKIDEGWPGWIDSDKTNFAWQLVAGVRLPVGRTIDLGLKYKYFNADIEDEDMFDHGYGADIKTHSLLASVLFNFGGAPDPGPRRIPPPPPPRARPAPPPPPPPVFSCERGPYIVFFDWDKADITPEAASVLNSAATAYGSCSNVPVMLAGYTDRSGSEVYNMGLAARRNMAVRGYLASRGVPDAAISSQAFGEANPRVPTADGVRELQNRRVEVIYGPGSGR